MKEQFSSLLSSLQEQEIQQLKYYAMYDKNVLINQVMRLMAVN